MTPAKVLTDYRAFVASKLKAVEPAGFDWPRGRLPRSLFGWQKDAARWALRLGRAALFLDTGLGKTALELAWADAVRRHTGKPVLLLCPLAVGPQTVREAGKFGVKKVAAAATQADVTGPGVWVTNYQKLHHFDPAAFGGVVLDESSILKSHDSKTRVALIEAFARTPYRLAATATPAPNDHEEMGNHSEFLGVCSRVEMLATYFVHDSADTGEWRLKGHAVKAFWEWAAAWALFARRPSDLTGDPADDAGYVLPPLSVTEHVVGDGTPQPGRLFTVAETTLSGQRSARRDTMAERVAKAVELVNAEPGEPCVVWCELNEEADAVTAAIPGAVQVAGADADDAKAERMNAFSDGRARVLVSKPSICGFGMNWQHCPRTVFVGLSHSYERFYQAVRRFWRYGQARPVAAHVVTSDREYGVLENVRRKQASHDESFAETLKYTAAVNRAAMTTGGPKVKDDYKTTTATGDGWTLNLGDCVEGVASLPAESVDYSVFSPPFASLYTYSDSPRDMGNVRDDEEFYAHFRFLSAELFRVLKPGRLVSFHAMNLPTVKTRDGVIGVKDFRGDVLRIFQAAGFIFHSEVCVWKDPVTAMQRTKALGLLHKQIKKDSCMSRQGIPDYVVTMRKPGVNPSPVAGRFEEYVGESGPEPTDDPERFSIEVWQRYASPVWMDVNQTRVLSYAGAREEQDERHICPLQLDVIERCLDLWTNPGDLVLSPFAGIGSEGYCSVLAGRRFVGFELKPSYFAQAEKNLNRAAQLAGQKNLLDAAGVA